MKYKFIVFNPIDKNLTIDQFLQILDGAIIQYNADNTIILENYLTFFAELDKIKKIGDKFILKLPYDWMINEEIFIALQFSRMTHKIILNKNNTGDVFLDISMCVTSIFVDTHERHELACTEHKKFSHFFTTYSWKNLVPDFEFVREVTNVDGLTKGIFIQGDIDNLKEFEVSFLGSVHISYNQLTNTNFSHKFSSNLLYISFTNDLNFKEYSKISYVSYMNLSGIESITYRLKFNTLQTKFNIYHLQLNCMEYKIGYLKNKIKIKERESTIYLQYEGSLINWIVENKSISYISCAIANKIINIGDTYCECDKCLNKFDKEALVLWFDSDSNQQNCPICREVWQNFIIYKNN